MVVAINPIIIKKATSKYFEMAFLLKKAHITDTRTLRLDSKNLAAQKYMDVLHEVLSRNYNTHIRSE